MRFRVVSDQPWDVRADVLVVPIVGEARFEGALDELDRRMGGELRALASFGELSARRFASALAAPGELAVGRVLAMSTGTERVDRIAVHNLAAAVERRLGGRHVGTLAFWLGGLPAELGDDAATTVLMIARGLVEGSYEPRAIYSDSVPTAPPALVEVTIVAPGASDGAGASSTGAGASLAELQAAADRGRIIGEGANEARTLANRAANDVSPAVLADEARAIAERDGLHVDVLGPEEATALGMGMFMAVGRGSDNPPRMIVMRSGAAGETDALGRHLAIVGKGVCFDSGGISIKPSNRMEEMKMDKTGAATVIAAIGTVARLAPGTPLLAVAPAVENMPGPHSTRPGDVVKALNGKTVDITNTDAEGRLILGDAMTYAERLGATHIVDVATLTGAVGRAFGNLVTGAFGTPQDWYDEVAAAGARSGERYTQIPLVDDYIRDMRSWYADFENSGGAEGSLARSGLFLREFRTVPWVHLDIGGTGYFTKTTPYASRGATGVTHATLVELALAGARTAQAGR